MPVKNQDYYALYLAQDDNTGEPVTGDAANHTLRLVKDGTVTTFIGTPTPVEVSSTYMPGIYGVLVPGADNTGENMVIAGTSSTADVSIFPGQWDNDSADLEAISDAVQTILSQFAVVVQFDGSGSADDRVLRLTRGDSYDNVLNAKKTFTVSSSIDLTTGLATLTTRDNSGNVLFAVTAVPVFAGGSNYTISPTITHSDTLSLPVGRGVGIWDLQVVVGSSYGTPILGTLQVDEDATI